MKPDAKLLFYLERRQQIDEWCKIAKRFPKFAHAYYRSLGSAFVDLGGELGDDVRVDQLVSGSWPRFAFYRDGWVDPAEGIPPATVSFEWYRPHADFDSAYVGIRSERKRHPAAPAVWAAVRAAMDGEDAPFSLERTTNWWPAWHRVKPASDRVWEDLDAFADEIVATVKTAWPVLAGWVDAGLNNLRQPGSHP